MEKKGKAEIEKILDKYSIGVYKSHKHLEDVLENEVYILATSKGKYVLKFLSKINLKNMREQLKVIDFLYSKGIPVVKNMVSKDGKELMRFGDGWVLIQKFVEGKHYDDFDNSLVKDIARNVGKMHKFLVGSKIGLKNKKDHVYKKRNLEAVKEYSLDVVQKNLFKNLNSMDKSKLRRARIHSDLSSVNLLIKNNRLNAIIDWDDSDYDYLVYEVAIFLAHSCVRSGKIYKDKIRTFLREYQKFIRLNSEEKRAVYFLMEYRLFGILNWYLQYMKSHPEREAFMLRGAERSVRRIFAFDKVSLEEFLELFD